MNLSSKRKGNLALARALSYFGERGYYLFLPCVGDNGGAIDLAISIDGTSLQRVQCKYPAKRHRSMEERYPDRNVWRVVLGTIGRGEENSYVTEAYKEDSFDWLFVRHQQVTTSLIGKSFAKNVESPSELYSGTAS